jgi:hypothetical protein
MITQSPVSEPTDKPTSEPTEKPTYKPTEKPTEKPTHEPTEKPTYKPTEKPTYEPTEKPTQQPSYNDKPLICSLTFDGSPASTYTNKVPRGCGLVAINDIGYAQYKENSAGLLVCGNTEIKQDELVRVFCYYFSFNSYFVCFF